MSRREDKANQKITVDKRTKKAYYNLAYTLPIYPELTYEQQVYVEKK